MAAEIAQTVPTLAWSLELNDKPTNELGSCESRETGGRHYSSSSKDALWSENGDRQARVPDGLRDAAGGGGGGGGRGFKDGVGGDKGSDDGERDKEDGNGGDEDEIENQVQRTRRASKPAKLMPRYSLPNRTSDGSCDTLSLDNLPTDIPCLDEHLKTLFSIQPGYKRMCFRTKKTGILCFIQFDDVQCATNALEKLNGHVLQSPLVKECENEKEMRLRYIENRLDINLWSRNG